MNKYLFLLIFFSLFSCNFKPRVVDCECKFMLDLIVKKEDSVLQSNINMFDPNMYNDCVLEYKDLASDNTPRPLLINVYKYYHNQCPSYDFEIIE